MTSPNTPADYDPDAGDGQADGCGNCGSATTDQLCPRCVRKVEKWAAEMPELVHDLETTIARQTRYGTGSGGNTGKGKTRPLIFNEDASDKREHVAIFIEWARHIAAEANPTPRPLRPSAIDLAARVRFAALNIVTNVAWFRTAPDAATCMDALWTIRQTLQRAVDRPGSDRWNAGPCGHVTSWASLDVCDLDVYARPGRDGKPPTLVCDGYRQGGEGCGTAHTIDGRDRFLLASLEDEVLPLSMLLPVLPKLLGIDPRPGTVRQWRNRGRLMARDVTAAGVELYRGGDLIRLARDLARRPGPKRRRETSATR